MFVLDVTLKDMEGTSKQHLKRKKSPELPQIGKQKKEKRLQRWYFSTKTIEIGEIDCISSCKRSFFS